jgi:hypothetical protein
MVWGCRLKVTRLEGINKRGRLILGVMNTPIVKIPKFDVFVKSPLQYALLREARNQDHIWEVQLF